MYNQTNENYTDIMYYFPNTIRIQKQRQLSEQHFRMELDKQMKQEESEDETTDVINWSGTHQVNVANKHFFEPESIEEVEKIVKDCQERGQTVRPLGSSLSPNGVALNKDGMISMANLDKVLEIDTENRTITVEAGIPVREVRNLSMNRGSFLNVLLFCQIVTHTCSLSGRRSLTTPQFDFAESCVDC